MPFTAVLLDLDGTLLDTIPDLANAANAMRQELGLPVLAPETIATYVGKGTEHLVMRALPNNPAGHQAKIGRAHVCTPVTNAHLVCSLLLEKQNTNTTNYN